MYKIKQSPEDFQVTELMELNYSDAGQYSYYLLWKRNYNTVDAINHVAKVWHIRPKFINFAGAKDRVAVTEQYISISHGPKKDLEQQDLSVEYLGQGTERISLGMLAGNHFKIRVQSDQSPKPISMMRNLFDSQRFGAQNNNHIIGKRIIKQEFAHALELIDDASAKQHLMNSPNDYVGALKKIPKKILQLYIHAYQSYLWNIMAKDSKAKKLPLIGYNTEMTKESIALLKKEGVTQSDFIIRPIPEISSEGTIRDVFVEVKNLKLGEWIECDLPPGAYATQAVREMFT